MLKKIVSKPLNAVRNPADLPSWWTLGTIAFAGVFGAVLLVSSLTGGDEVSANAVPSYAVGSSGGSQETNTGDVSGAGEVVETIPEAQVDGGTGGGFEVSVAVGAPRVISRGASVLSGSLVDDGNTVDIRSGADLVTVPRNVLATATAGFWSVVDPNVANNLPVAGDGGRFVPNKNWKNATLSKVELKQGGGSRWVFTGSVDKDGPGSGKAEERQVVVVESAGGYAVVSS